MPSLPVLLMIPALVTGAADFPDALQRSAAAATVRVVNGAGKAVGSGTIVKKSGPFVYILTANHVVDGEERPVIVTFPAGATAESDDHTYRSAKVIARTKQGDLALIRLAAGDGWPEPLPVCPPELVPRETAFPVLSVGCAEGAKGPSCWADRVRGKKRVRKKGQKEAAYFWEVTKKPVSGRSGGPLVDRRGYLLGVCSGSNGDLGYYCHIDEVHAFLRTNGFRWLYSKEEK